MRTPEQKERQAKYQRERYAAGGAAARKNSRERVAVVRSVRIPAVNKIKMERGCIDCGFNAHPAALHFDHVVPATKLFSIAKGLTRSWSAILAEIAKCEVRCANCHAIRGVQEGHLGRPRTDLAEITNADGVNVADQLMAEGLGWPYKGGRR